MISDDELRAEQKRTGRRQVRAICVHCGKEYLSSATAKTRGRKYCSRECNHLAHRGSAHHNWVPHPPLACLYCGNEFIPQCAKVAEEGKTKYCSISCRGKDLSSGEKNPMWAGKSFERPCNYCGKPFKTTQRQIEIGGGKYCSLPCKYDSQRDPNGKMSEARTARRGAPCAKWRKAILARDEFTCLDCGAQNVKLHVHHIKSFAKFPELRYVTANGKTLCVDCHYAYHPWMAA